ncbi:MAG: hypothetical protein K8W52_13825 [Deltaproteobacteria bacterium]|nr:hypothetical protein [Deltaproteobacteria bacterium]
MNRASSIALSSILVAAALTACKSKAPDAAAKPAEAAAAPTPVAAPAPAPAVAAPTPAPAPAAPTAPAGPLPLAMPVPASATSFSTDDVAGEHRDQASTVADFKQELTDSGATFVSDEKLADGWAVRYRESDATIVTTAERTLGGAVWRCRSNGADQIAHDRGRAACLAVSASGGGLAVPFTPTEDGVGLSDGTMNLKASLATADTAATVEAATADATKGLKVIEQGTAPGGFAVAYQTWNGGIEAQGLIYRATVRAKLGAIDLLCEPWAGAKSAAEATAAMNACKGLIAR